MSGAELVLDTNILIYLTSGNTSVVQFLEKKKPVISFISQMELLSWPSLSEKDIRLIKSLLSDCKIVQLSDSIRDEAIAIRRATRIKLPVPSLLQRQRSRDLHWFQRMLR